MRPTVSITGTDTVFCWKKWQATTIAQLLEEGRYQKSVNAKLEQDNLSLWEAIRTKDNVIITKEMQVQNLVEIRKINENSILVLEEAMKKNQRKLKKGRFHKGMLSLGMGLLAILAISK